MIRPFIQYDITEFIIFYLTDHTLFCTHYEYAISQRIIVIIVIIHLFIFVRLREKNEKMLEQLISAVYSKFDCFIVVLYDLVVHFYYFTKFVTFYGLSQLRTKMAPAIVVLMIQSQIYGSCANTNSRIPRREEWLSCQETYCFFEIAEKVYHFHVLWLWMGKLYMQTFGRLHWAF